MSGRPKKYSEMQGKLWREMYESGMKSMEIAEAHGGGVGHSTILEYIRRAGGKTAGRGRPRKDKS